MEKQDTQVRDHNPFATQKLNFGKFYIAMLRVAVVAIKVDTKKQPNSE